MFSIAQRMCAITVLLLLLLGCASQVFTQQAAESNAARKNRAAAPQIIPFELYLNSLIFVRARVNDSAPMWFLLDTASTFSFLDTAKAESLGIKSEGQETITGGGGGAIGISFGKGATLEVSGVKLAHETFALTLWKKGYDRNVVGMIGAPFFKQFVVEIDYQARQLIVHEPRSYRYAGKGAILPLEFSDEIPAVEVGLSIGARPPLTAKLDVDTGAGQTLILNPAFVAANNLLGSTEGIPKTEGGSLAGKVTYYTRRAKTVRLGRFALENIPANLSSPGGLKIRDGVDGVIGNWLLSRFKVILDFPRSRMILEPSELFSVSPDYEMTGLRAVAEGKQFKIAQVFNGSPADEAGLKAGDAIIAFDGHPAAQMTITQLRQMFKQDGGKHSLLIERAATKLPITLQMRLIQ